MDLSFRFKNEYYAVSRKLCSLSNSWTTMPHPQPWPVKIVEPIVHTLTCGHCFDSTLVVAPNIIFVENKTLILCIHSIYHIYSFSSRGKVVPRHSSPTPPGSPHRTGSSWFFFVWSADELQDMSETSWMMQTPWTCPSQINPSFFIYTFSWIWNPSFNSAHYTGQVIWLCGFGENGYESDMKLFVLAFSIAVWPVGRLWATWHRRGSKSSRTLQI